MIILESKVKKTEIPSNWDLGLLYGGCFYSPTTLFYAASDTVFPEKTACAVDSAGTESTTSPAECSLELLQQWEHPYFMKYRLQIIFIL